MRLRLPPFTTRWVTAVALGTYACLFALVIQVHEVLPSAPSSHGALDVGIDLERAWSDLNTIAARPHPYNSHENGVVRAYLLQRVRGIAESYHNVYVADDVVNNVTYVENGLTVFYVEGSNVLVKVTGRNASLPAVLFSAHFDSSATAQGATDDGMGVVSLLLLIEQLARKPSLRTAIFNLNNGEEDGLCGSHVLSASLSKEAAVFLNLEGAGSGGRPILFRASTAHLVKVFQRTGRPHGTITSSDAYALGLIKSQTDFEVYAKGGLKGLDLTFYKNRDKYHTMADNVSNLNGPHALWTELQITKDVGEALTNLEDEDTSTQAVYWDVLGRKMIVFTFIDFVQRLPRLLISTTCLIIGMMAFLWYMGAKFAPRREWIYFPVSLLLGIASSTLLAALYCTLNPMIIYSSPYLVITSIGTCIILSTLQPLHRLHVRSATSPSEQKSIVWSQYFIFMLVGLLGYVQVLNKSTFGGFYFIEWLYGGAALGLILDAAGECWSLVMKSKSMRASRPFRSDEGEDVTAPLLQMSDLNSQGDVGHSHGGDSQHSPNQLAVLWIVELVLTAVPPLVLVFPLTLVVTSGLGQTLADGSAPAMVYGGITVLLFLCFIPLVPFAHQISSRLFVIVAVIFVASTLYNFVAFPFSKHRQVKLFYTQNLDLESGRNTVELLGVQPYLRQALRSIPSAGTNANITWSTDSIRRLGEARWEGPMPFISPAPSKLDLNSLVISTARRLDAETAVFTVRGKDTKSCVIRFDQNIINVEIKRSERIRGDSISKFGSSVGIPKHTAYSIPPNGVPIVTLWSREWDTEFEVTVKWNATASSSVARDGHVNFSWRSLLPSRISRGPTYTGRIGCQWADNQRGQITALEELVKSLPEWATITAKKALLTADRSFSV